MASSIMHLYLADKIQKKYNLSDEFFLWQLVPDLLKFMNISRYTTHYINGPAESDIDIEGYIKNNKEDINSMKNLGIIAHLIEDKIWFKKYCLVDKMPDLEYKELWYPEFPLIDRYIFKKYNFEDRFYEIVKCIKSMIKGNQKALDIVSDEVKLYDIKERKELQLISEEIIEKYIFEALEEVDKVYKKIGFRKIGE